ncbi:hypothetical protein TNCV_3366571 [Trichonephila clavipes]|nr:hypothetical protein TNCV_3366571 [Trichonephila clavipes]
MGLHIGISTFADIVHSPGAGITFSAAPFRRYQLPRVVLAPSFFSKGRHLSSADMKFVQRNLNLPRASKPNGHSKDLFHAAVDFLHSEYPDLGRGRTRNLRYRRPATNQLRQPASTKAKFQTFLSQCKK